MRTCGWGTIKIISDITLRHYDGHGEVSMGIQERLRAPVTITVGSEFSRTVPAYLVITALVLDITVTASILVLLLQR